MPMSEMPFELRDEIDLAGGNLITGNQDSLTLLGAVAQSELRRSTNYIAQLALQNDCEVVKTISAILSEIDQFYNGKWSSPCIKRIFGVAKKTQRQYQAILSSLDQVTLSLQLQQAQLLKEVKVLEKLNRSMLECGEELEKCVDRGISVLQKRTEPENSELNSWYVRLENKIANLKVSRTIALQTQMQIKLLYDHDLVLIDKISYVISNTLVICRTQIAMYLERGREQRFTKFQVNSSAEQYEAHSNLFPDGNKNLQTWDSTLKTYLEEIAALEGQDYTLRNEVYKASNVS